MRKKSRKLSVKKRRNCCIPGLTVLPDEANPSGSRGLYPLRTTEPALRVIKNNYRFDAAIGRGGLRIPWTSNEYRGVGAEHWAREVSMVGCRVTERDRGRLKKGEKKVNNRASEPCGLCGWIRGSTVACLTVSHPPCSTTHPTVIFAKHLYENIRRARMQWNEPGSSSGCW